MKIFIITFITLFTIGCSVHNYYDELFKEDKNLVPINSKDIQIQLNSVKDE